MRLHLFILLVAIYLPGCSDNNNASNPATGLKPFPVKMDESRTSPVRLQGKVLNWFFEGDAGCYITLTDNNQQIEARAEANACEFMKVSVNDVIDLELFYDPKQDYGDKDNPMFTVKRFFTP